MRKWLAVFMWTLSLAAWGAETVKIGLNYPVTGRYKQQGLSQARGALLAQEEINAGEGILGRKLEIISANSASSPERSVKNVRKLVNQDRVSMLFGGVSSAVAIEAGKAAAALDRIYFGTLTYSNATTGAAGHRYMFREPYNAWMSAKVLASYLNKHYKDKRYFYVTADYTWGWSTEQSLRQLTNTDNNSRHAGVKTKFPKPRQSEFQTALAQARTSGAEVLVLVQFGDDMVRALKMARKMGLKEEMDIVVPNLTLGMAQSAGPAIMEGVVGAVPWSWNVPYEYGFDKGINFVEKYRERFGENPSSSAASAYSIVYQYRDAVETAGTLDSKAVIKALEDHRYSLLKGEQYWRAMDHQNVQTVYAVKCKPRSEVLSGPFKTDFFEIVASLPGEQAVKTRQEWLQARQAAGKSGVL